MKTNAIIWPVFFSASLAAHAGLLLAISRAPAAPPRPPATAVMIEEDELLSEAATPANSGDMVSAKSVTEQGPAAIAQSRNEAAEQPAAARPSPPAAESKASAATQLASQSENRPQEQAAASDMAKSGDQLPAKSLNAIAAADKSAAENSNASSATTAPEALSGAAQTGDTDHSRIAEADPAGAEDTVISAEADPGNASVSIAPATTAAPDQGAANAALEETGAASRPAAADTANSGRVAATAPDVSVAASGESAGQQVALNSQESRNDQVSQALSGEAERPAAGASVETPDDTAAAPLEASGAAASQTTAEALQAPRTAIQSTGQSSQQAITGSQIDGDATAQQAVRAQQSPASAPSQTSELDVATALPLLPSDSIQQQLRNFVTGYDGGRCFFAVPVALDRLKPRIEGFGVSLNAIADFSSRLHANVDTEADVTARMITNPQCAAADFLKARLQQHADELTIHVDREQIGNGERLSGEIDGLGQSYVSLVIIDDDGHVSNLSKYVHRTDTDTTFSAPIQLKGAAHKRNQILVALASNANLPSLQPWLQSRDSEALFRSLEDQAREANAELAIGIAVFQVD